MGVAAEAPDELGDEHRIDLDREHVRGLPGERPGQVARARAEIDDAFGARDVRFGHEAADERFTLEEVLVQRVPARCTRRRLPGHGAP